MADGHYCNITVMKIIRLLFVFYVINFSKAANIDLNLALNQKTKQSANDNFGYKSMYAADGDFATAIGSGARCAQPCGSGSTIPWHWWQVDLQGTYTVGSFSFTCQSDGHHWQNKNFAVEVSTDDPTTLYGFPARTNASECLVKRGTIRWSISRFTMQCKKPVQGRYVRVVKYPGSGKLVICEFEVFEIVKGVRVASTDRKNLALTKPTSIDGITFQASPSVSPEKRSQFMAVDGTVDGYGGGLGLCYVSQLVDPLFPFLVDLEDTYLIDTIFITNVLEYEEKLQNISVEVSMQVPAPNDSNIQVCFKQLETLPIGYIVEYKCNQPIVGRYVRLVRFSQSLRVFVLCELQVYGEPLINSTQSTKSITSSTNSPTNLTSTQLSKTSTGVGLELDLDVARIQIWRFDFIKSNYSTASFLKDTSVFRMLSHCARNGLRMGINSKISPMKYILTNVRSWECCYRNSLEEIVLHWVVYKIELD